MNRFFSAVALCALVAAPSRAAISRTELQKALENNPDLILAALKKDSTTFFQAIIDAQHDYQVEQNKQEEERQKQERDEAFKKPYKPALAKAHVRGDKNAPITLVEYSDFQCPFCGRGFLIVEQVRKKYGSRLRFVFKDFPLTNLHPQAEPAARWFEAVALQSPAKAWLFHDKMFENQDKLGEDFFRKTVKALGLDVAKAARDAAGPAVQARIDADTAEARRFGFTGTPGFLINGIPLRGAYPASEFDAVINDPRFKALER